MSPWPLAVWAMLPPLVVGVAGALRGTVAARIVAVQFASAVVTVLLGLMSFAFDQDSYVAMAVALALLNTVGTLVVAAAVEHWL